VLVREEVSLQSTEGVEGDCLMVIIYAKCQHCGWKGDAFANYCPDCGARLKGPVKTVQTVKEMDADE
jgi:uncharacterized OB-fold protein